MFQRDRIRERKGPQFITIKTTVLSRDGIPRQTNERRIVRFPVNLGIGTFGENSPIDVSAHRGGFVVPIFLDVVEVMRVLDIDFVRKINGGLGLTPFFPLQKKPRLLFFAQISWSF